MYISRSNKAYIRVFIAICMLILLMGCLHDSDSAIGTVTVPLEVNETGLMESGVLR